MTSNKRHEYEEEFRIKQSSEKTLPELIEKMVSKVFSEIGGAASARQSEHSVASFKAFF